MCGINGIFAYNSAASSPKEAEVLRTRDHMRMRGPDGHGAWWSSDRRTGLAHRRLSIVDLSDRAAQPMISGSGRYAISFNGEIYNYRILRQQLEIFGISFRTTSDTEVILALFERYGSEAASMLRGMFAFAIWDEKLRRLYLARDPYGIKPLYLSDDGWAFRFASQVKALLAGGGVSSDPDPAGIVGFLLWGSVPEPFTCYREIRSLPAGHYQYVDETGPCEPRQYASIAGMFGETYTERPVSDMDAVVRMAALDSVQVHLLADVEVGVFLSAGIDSGAVLGLMADAGHQRIKALTLQFAEFVGTSEDETPLAGEIARQYGADHLVRLISQREFEDDYLGILDAMDQPSVDGINSWFAAKFASELGLKVALSGVGGDELLGGYPSFVDIPRMVRWLGPASYVPGLSSLSAGMVKALGLHRKMPKLVSLFKLGGSYAGAYFLRRALFLPSELAKFLSADFISIGLQRLKPLIPLRKISSRAGAQPHAKISALESEQYLRNQLLRDSDWAGMAHGVEIRMPLVDQELLRSLAPFTGAMGGLAGKRALARAPIIPLPFSVVNRSKTGFGVPTGDWLQDGTAMMLSNKGLASRKWAGDILTQFGHEQRSLAVAGTATP